MGTQQSINILYGVVFSWSGKKYFSDPLDILLGSQLDTFNGLFLLALNWGASGVNVKSSDTPRDIVYRGVLSGRPLGAKEIVVYHYGNLVYSNLTTRKQIRNAYCGSVMPVTLKDFSTWAFKYSEMVLDCTRKERSAWIVSADFCSIQYNKNSRYFPWYKASRIQCGTQPQENNISYVQMSSPDCASELKDYRKIAVNALQNKYVRKMLYSDYCSEYSFLWYEHSKLKPLQYLNWYLS